MNLISLAAVRFCPLFNPMPPAAKTLLRVMRLTAFILISFCVHVSASGISQKISFAGKNAKLSSIFSTIKEQTGYVVFCDYSLLENAAPVTLHVKDIPLKTFLDTLSALQSLRYRIKHQSILISTSSKSTPGTQPDVYNFPGILISVSGVVKDESGQPLAGVSIRVKGSTASTISGEYGVFKLENIEPGATLEFSSVGFETLTTPVNGNTWLNVQLKVKVNNLDETVVIGYGTSKKEILTGSVSHVKSTEIESQPVTNPLGALQGRVPGVVIKTATGVPGGNITVQIRGKNSITGTSNPLFIIDGVQVPGTNINKVTNTAIGVVSPFTGINPADIATIDILKDADATAIYGSRGANGVVLITTKRGRSGKPRIDFNIYTGNSTPTRLLKGFLTTPEYLDMRRAAFKADNITPDATNAPDLLLWDPNQNTDWQKLLIGNTASLTNIQASFSGGDASTRFLVSTSYHQEGAIMLGDNKYKRYNLHLSMEHTSPNKRMNILATTSYNIENNKTISGNLFYNIVAAPNAPLYDSTGKAPYFVSGNSSFTNPIARTFGTAKTLTDNFITNVKVRYTLFKNLDLSFNTGYTKMNMIQNSKIPSISQNPTITNLYNNSAYFSTSYVQNYNLQPQIDYTLSLGKGLLKATAGELLNSNISGSNYIMGANFSSNQLLESLAAAGLIVSKTSTYTDYKFRSAFGRLNYSWQDKYIVNVSFSQDKSTRFGPDNRIANFWAGGAAWLFSKEPWLQQHFPTLSFGKLRMSYGVTGNDQIGDYRYLSLYANTTAPYQGISGLYASQLGNDLFRWETTRKWSAAMDLGFCNNRIYLSVEWYRNRSNNLLVNQAISRQTGFSAYLANSPALVQNKGWELQITTSNIESKNFRWTSTFNISLPQNRLLSYPNLESSSNASSLVIGKSITLQRLLHYVGVNPDNGAPLFEDVDKNGTIGGAGDYTDAAGDLDSRVYGGFGNTWSYKGFQLDIFFQFNKQQNFNFWTTILDPAGTMSNSLSSLVNGYWKKAGDTGNFGLTTTPSSVIGTAYTNLSGSNIVVSNASYVRLKTLSLSYTLPSKRANTPFQNTSIFINGQNLLTFTNYFGVDPETGSATPPLKTITIGIKTSL